MRLISKKSVLRILQEEPSYYDTKNAITEIYDKINELPTIEERKTGEWGEEDVDSVLASIRTDCKQKINCDGCRFYRGDSAMCGIWGLPSNWAVEMEGAEE